MLCAGVVAVVLLISKFFHPSKTIFDKYPNRPKNHKLKRVVFVEEDVKFVRQGSNEILVFVFTHADFPNQQFYSAKWYIHVTQEFIEDSPFVLSKAPVTATGAGGIGALAVGRKDRTDDAEANDAPNLLSGCTPNLRLEDMAELFLQGITIDDDKNAEPYNFPRQV